MTFIQDRHHSLEAIPDRAEMREPADSEVKTYKQVPRVLQSRQNTSMRTDMGDIKRLVF